MKKLLILAIIGTLSLGMVGCAETVEETNTEVAQTEEVEVEEASEETEEIEVVEVEETEEAEEPEEVDEALETEATCPYEGRSQLSFSTVDIFGNSVSTSDFADAKLIMLNMWEPWCGPCVGEMPDLELLYEKYQDDGFVILGAFSTEGYDSDVIDVMDYCGTTYPIIRYVSSMDKYATDYVPTTIFMDQHGHVITDEPIIVAQSYGDWEKLIKEYLNK